MNFIAEMQILKRKNSQLQVEIDKLTENLDIRYGDLKLSMEREEYLQKKLAGFEGAVLEPLQEKYESVREQNVNLQTKVDEYENETARQCSTKGCENIIDVSYCKQCLRLWES